MTKLKLLMFFVVMLVAGAFWLWSNQSSEEFTPSVATVSTYKEPDFYLFVGAWNDKVRAFDLRDGHLLSSMDDKLMIRQFRTYIEYFSHPLPKKISNELGSMSQSYPYSIWSMYQEFIKSYIGKYHGQLNWSSIDSSEKLNAMILDVVKTRSSSFDVDESIKLLLAASDPCAYFNIYKTELWKRGLSKNFRVCDSSIIAQEAHQYPALSVLIRQ